MQEVLKPKCCFEIGAFDAMFSVQMKKIVPGIRAVAFEANPYNYEYIKKKEYILESGVEYIHSAVSDVVGKVSFYVQRSRNGRSMSLVRGNNSMLERNEDGMDYEMVEVESTTIDAFFDSEKINGLNAAVWIDVEGATESVLKGGKCSIKNFGTILIEVEDDEKWKNQWLSMDVVKFLLDNNFSPVARDFEYSSQYNILFCNNNIIGLSKIRSCMEKYYSLCNLVSENNKNRQYVDRYRGVLSLFSRMRFFSNFYK